MIFLPLHFQGIQKVSFKSLHSLPRAMLTAKEEMCGQQRLLVLYYVYNNRISSLCPDTRFLTRLCRLPVSLGEWALHMPATTPGFSCGFWDSNSTPHSISSQFHWADTKLTRGSSSHFSLPILETPVLLTSWPLFHFQSWYHRLCLHSVSLSLLLPSYKHLNNLE